MSADTLRKAAALMRERAEDATPGPWFPVEGGYTFNPSVATRDADIYQLSAEEWVAESTPDEANGKPNAAHIASWHPAVALAVADWLDAEAQFCDESPFYADLDTDDERAAFLEKPLAVARAYLGEVAP